MNRSVRDAAIFALFLGATVSYLRYWPHDFYFFDEGLFLYEAKRVLQGDVMYRDFFDIRTPAWFYLFAGLYALLGVSMETARFGMAIVHGLIGGLTYLACRFAGVRVSIAILAALTHLTLGYPTCTIATPHWLSTLVILIQLLIILRTPSATAKRALLWGALAGVLILVQHQMGVIMAVGVGAVLIFDHMASAKGAFSTSLLRQAAVYTAGLLLVAGPVMLAFVAIAGFDDVFRALVEYPLVNYRRIHEGIAWGVYAPRLVPLGLIVKCLPLVLPPAFLVALRRWRMEADRQQMRPLVVTLILSMAALGSVVYHKDQLHFAYVAPLWFSLTAQLLEALLQYLEERLGGVRITIGVAALLLMIGCGWQLLQNLRSRQRIFRVPVQTAFGRIDFYDEHDVERFHWLSELLRDRQVNEIFAYPTDAGIYLLTGTRNPTRYQVVLPRYTGDDQIAEIIANLEARRVPIVITNPYWGFGLLRSLNSYVAQKYEVLKMPVATTGATAKIHQRRPDLRKKDGTFF